MIKASPHDGFGKSGKILAVQRVWYVVLVQFSGRRCTFRITSAAIARRSPTFFTLRTLGGREENPASTEIVT